MKIIKRDPDKGYMDNWLWAPKKWINTEALMSSLSFAFSDSYTGEQKILYLWRDSPHHLGIPRMVWKPGQLTFEVVDCRPQSFLHVPFKSKIKLDHRNALVDGKNMLTPTGDNVQHLSIAALQAAMGGVLQLACGKGKTCIALEHIARNQVPAIVVVDNTNLLYQWEREINALLEIPGGIGYFMGGHDDWRGKGIVLATYHTLGGRADSLPEDFRRYFGAAYYDEGHHASAPLFSRGVSAIYGRRYSLTATPERDDGQHIIADLHIGPVLHKDLRPMMKPQIFFYWTGLELDVTHPDVQRGCYDVNGELHLSKIKSYLGRWRERMWLLLHKVLDATKHKRKVLLLSDSVEEVVNLLAMWTRGPHTQLCSELPFPTLADINETLEPLTLEDKRAKEIKKNIKNIWTLVNKGGVDFKMHGAEVRVTKGSVRLAKLQEYMESWQRYLVYQKLLAEERRRQRVFLKELLDESTTAGVMTFGVDPRTRQRYLDERDVVFAITKYGKEGLDCEMLDTVLVSSIFSSKNGLQQLNGRPTRPKPGKKMPTIVLFVDAIGQMRGMEQKLMRHLRQWPHEEGGPYEFELINYPKVTACKTSTLEEAFGR